MKNFKAIQIASVLAAALSASSAAHAAPATAPSTSPVPRRPAAPGPRKVVASPAAKRQVAPAQKAPAQKAPAQKAPAQKAPAPQKVVVWLPAGYKNGAATVKAGKPVALTFVLQSEAGCGNTVSVPAAKWKRSLAVGERATLIYTPKTSGPLAFECGMGMYKGTLTVK